MPAMTGSGTTHDAMKIGELADRSGFTVRAIRFYERRGLLTPAARRPSGYRIYTTLELHRLAFIRHAKALGLTLAAIHPLVSSFGQQNGVGTRRRLARVLDERIRQTADQLETLTALRAELRRRRRALVRRPRRRGACGVCTCLKEA